jgi:hypothetical protein
MRRVCSVILACACAVAGLAACSTGHGPVSARLCAAVATRGYALDLTTAGRVRWRVLLGPLGSDLHVSPLAVGPVSVFAQGDVLYGLHLADGHRLWSRVAGQDIAEMWRWQRLVVVLTQSDCGLPRPVLTGLDASTGQPGGLCRSEGRCTAYAEPLTVAWP